MKFAKRLIIPLICIAVCGWFLRSAFIEVKNRAIDQLNNQQLVMAETAARGIESFFEHYTEVLTQFARMNEIASFEDQGRLLMQILYRTHASEIKAVSRVDASGRIIYTCPETPGAVGTDLSSQEHIQRIIQTQQPVISDVFDTVQGFAAIAFHVPVFKDEAFQGSLAVLIPFDQLSRNYLEPIQIGKDGYAWMISQKRIELYCPVPGHIGKSVFENCSDFPTILSMANEMMRGGRGTTHYYFNRVRGETAEVQKKQAAYVPVHVGDSFWSIVVATPEEEALEIIQGFKDRWFLLSGLLMLTTVLWTFHALRAFKVLKEEEKRKRAEAALKASERKYRELVESANSIILRLDAEGRVTFFNEFAERFFGYSEEEILGRHAVGTIVPPTESSGRDLAALLGEIVRNPDAFVDNENENIRRNGERVWIAWTNKSILDEDGRIREVLCVGHDVSDRKSAEHALRESEEQFKAIFAMASIGMAQADPKTRQWLRVNRKMCEITGYSPDEMLSLRIPEITHPEDREADWQAFQDVIDDKRKNYRLEKRYIRKDGNVVWVNVNMTVIRAPNGHPTSSIATIEDVTERKRAEEELAVNSNRLSRAEIISRSGNWEFLLESRRVFASDGARKIYGFLDEEWTIPEVQKLPLPEYRDMLDRALRNLVDENRPYDVEFKIRRPDTGEIVDIHSVAEYDPRRKVVFGIIQDITAHKRAESQRQAAIEALAKSESLIRAITDSAQDAIVMMAPTGRISFWNPAAEQIFGYTSEEANGRMLHRFLAPERYLEAYEAAFSQFEKTGCGDASGKTLELQASRKNGEEFPIELSLSAIQIEDGWHAVGIIRDITDRKRAETALRESEARLMAFMEFVPALTLIKDHELRPVYANRKYREVFPVDEWLGKKPHEAFPAEVANLMVRRDTEALRNGYICYEETWLDQDQVPHVHQTQRFRIDIQDSEPLLGLVIADITDQKRMEQERQELQERLYRAEKMEALGTLAGGVAHDLNNVLGVLVGYSELLLERIPVDSRSRKYVTNILKSGEWGAAIIQDLLTLARRGVAIAEVLNLNQLITEYLGTLEFERLKTDNAAVTFRTDLDKDLMNIKGSRTHLCKTLMNLLSNAAEAIEGMGEILIRTENYYLDRPVKGYDTILEGDYAVLTVSDNGKGIPAMDLGKIFEPFYTKKVMGRSGTGLGLAVVWGTVKDHGGYVDVRSEEGRGSSFTMYFPVTREELVRDQQQPLSPDQYLGKEESILVVDDVAAQRELAISMLTRLGYRVHAVSGGEEAVSYLKANKADLMVLDMIMEPGIDGLETYQRVLEINPKQKAIIVSGFSETARVRKAQSLGAGPYVKKPYLLERLGLAVRKELDRPA